MIKVLLSLILSSTAVAKAATLGFDDPNNLGGTTTYVVSNKVNSGPWLHYTNTLSRLNNYVPLVPGTNWFSVTITNSTTPLKSDTTTTNGIVPFRVFNIIIEANANLSDTNNWTNVLVYAELVDKSYNFLRIRTKINDL